MITLGDYLSNQMRNRQTNKSDMLQITYSAMLTFARGRHHEAAVAAERALQLNPDYNMALWTLGAAQVFAGKYADGIETATRAVNVDIRDPYVHLYSRIVGYGYFAAEEHGDAADWFWKADQLAPGLPHNLTGLAVCQWNNADYEGVHGTISRLLDEEPKFRVGDMMALPVASASFDLVTTGYGLRNVPDLERSLAEIHRVLRPGGRFAFCVGHPAYAMFGEEGYDLSKPYFQRDAEFIWPFDDGHVSRMTVVHHTSEDLFDALRLAGFQVERLLEPEFTEREVGNWKRDVERAKSIPRTIIFAARKPPPTRSRFTKRCLSRLSVNSLPKLLRTPSPESSANWLRLMRLSLSWLVPTVF